MTREEELAELRAKLKASKGRPGLQQRTEAIEARIADLEGADGH